jgi:hypothetical protein
MGHADTHLELVTGSKTPDAGVKNAMLRALHEVVSKAGSNMSETSKQSILGLIDDDSGERDGTTGCSTSHTSNFRRLTHTRCNGYRKRSIAWCPGQKPHTCSCSSSHQVCHWPTSEDDGLINNPGTAFSFPTSPISPSFR